MFRIGKKQMLAAAALMTVVGGSVAYARRFPAFQGQAQNPAHYAYFINRWGAVIQVGDDNEQYCISLPVDTGGAKRVTVTAKGRNESENLSCFLQVTDKFNGDVWFSGRRSLPAFGSYQLITFSIFSVPADGVMYLCCDMDRNALLGTVDYPQ